MERLLAPVAEGQQDGIVQPRHRHHPRDQGFTVQPTRPRRGNAGGRVCGDSGSGGSGDRNSPTSSLGASSAGGSSTLAGGSVVSALSAAALSQEDTARRRRARLARLRKLDRGDQATLLRKEERERWIARRNLTDPEVFSLADLRMLRQVFDLIDADGSGSVSTTELEDVLLSTGLARTKMEVERQVAIVDQDRSGEVDFEEFVAGMRCGPPMSQSVLAGAGAGPQRAADARPGGRLEDAAGRAHSPRARAQEKKQRMLLEKEAQEKRKRSCASSKTGARHKGKKRKRPENWLIKRLRIPAPAAGSQSDINSTTTTTTSTTTSKAHTTTNDIGLGGSGQRKNEETQHSDFDVDTVLGWRRRKQLLSLLLDQPQKVRELSKELTNELRQAQAAGSILAENRIRRKLQSVQDMSKGNAEQISALTHLLKNHYGVSDQVEKGFRPSVDAGRRSISMPSGIDRSHQRESQAKVKVRSTLEQQLVQIAGLSSDSRDSVAARRSTIDPTLALPTNFLPSTGVQDAAFESASCLRKLSSVGSVDRGTCGAGAKLPDIGHSQSLDSSVADALSRASSRSSSPAPHSRSGSRMQSRSRSQSRSHSRNQSRGRPVHSPSAGSGNSRHRQRKAGVLGAESPNAGAKRSNRSRGHGSNASRPKRPPARTVSNGEVVPRLPILSPIKGSKHGGDPLSPRTKPGQPSPRRHIIVTGGHTPHAQANPSIVAVSDWYSQSMLRAPVPTGPPGGLHASHRDSARSRSRSRGRGRHRRTTPSGESVSLLRDQMSPLQTPTITASSSLFPTVPPAR